MTVVAIHQPEYFPLLSYLDKAARADVFVLLDHVQFDRTSLQHRARIDTANGPIWMTIPFVHRFPQRIVDVEIADRRWATKHEKTIRAAYGRAPAFAQAAGKLAEFFAAGHRRLADATVDSVRLLFEAFGVTPRVVRSSSLDLHGTRGALVLEICQRLGATRYLSGRTGASYLDRDGFARAGVAIEVQRFEPPAYPRLRAIDGDELTRLSAIDAWVHVGADAPALLRRERT